MYRGRRDRRDTTMDWVRGQPDIWEVLIHEAIQRISEDDPPSRTLEDLPRSSGRQTGLLVRCQVGVYF